MSLLSELRRRNVIRMAGLYVVGAWLVVQVAETVLPAFDVPGWVLRAVIILLAIGFLPALVLSWVFELTPDGLKRESALDPARRHDHVTARKLDVAVILLLLAVGGLTLWSHQRGPAPASDSPPQTAEGSASDTGPDAATASPASPTAQAASIAVLPFVNMSPDPEQEYFSDGISEEILNALVKVRGLQVASRTSAFGFKGQEALGVPTIAERLGVRHVLEGSVRRAGNTLRITAQLIDAQTDRHLWSETFDRPLTAENVFAIQEEISTAIVAALKASLALGDVGQLALTQPTDNLSAYDLYLQARSLMLGRRALDRAEQLLAKSLELDPAFAKAWELRAAITSLLTEYGFSELDPEMLDKQVVEYAGRALDLEPQSSLALAAMARVRGQVGRSLRGRVDFASVLSDLEAAIEIDPHNINAMNWLALTWALLGERERALSMFDRCHAVDPRFAPCAENRFDSMWVLGRNEEAYAAMLESLSRGVNVEGYANLHLLAEFEQRAAFLLLMNHPLWLPGWNRGNEMYEAFRHPQRDHAALREDLIRFLGDREQTYYMPTLLVPLGDYAAPPPSWLLWGEVYADYRRSPQFHALAAQSGMLDYWRAHRFPPQCRAASPDGFECGE
ncbi:tetratricopeptide repeat protein [Pseudomarimonas salicorniae]|uniref:TolB amino-terminal domain-containing protein n=1 Tax=Pseudomarimonas salicorniae TaxID=2933270 RepID=A0ABT0GDV8_9GAMM|nr:hypothetical protein [Lysobacter sp. CAU 1642]MCK7592731.1 hypothetical protein [Lysobacter sp. CAU 1642]